MTYQVKEGDVLEYRGDGESTSLYKFTIGKRYVIKICRQGLYINSDTNERAYLVVRQNAIFGFHLVPTTPPATIQHEGYNYTRGEPVVPEWVKDGAWVVHKLTEEVKQIHIMLESNLEMVAQFFRPFTNEDWKWGMWAEYQGDKVFVSGQWDGCVEASKPTNPYFYIPFSEITPTTAP